MVLSLVSVQNIKYIKNEKLPLIGCVFLNYKRHAVRIQISRDLRFILASCFSVWDYVAHQ